MARALELKLNNSGFEAKAVYDGEAAIEELSKEKYDLMLLDLIMLKLDGFGVLEEVKKQKIKISIIVSSNLSQEEDFKKAKELGANDFFVKADTPIADVIKYIKKVLD
jgi:DNA-binding response OmpR family regulator